LTKRQALRIFSVMIIIIAAAAIAIIIIIIIIRRRRRKRCQNIKHTRPITWLVFCPQLFKAFGAPREQLNS
jgi:NADH:ubiquinone oxidoreductase subunit K